MNDSYIIDDVSNLNAILMDGISVTVFLHPPMYSNCSTSIIESDEGCAHTEERHLHLPSHEYEDDSRNKSDGTIVPHILGDDGNLHYCAICLDVGEVVCCDGCPKVYHINCIPHGCKSRIDLDADADPWYCPECLSRGKRATNDMKSPIDESKHKPADSTPLPLNFGNRRAAKEANNTPSKEIRHQKSSDSLIRRKRKSSMDVNPDEPPKKKREYERTANGLVKILPPFHYYLLDHRERISRALTKKMSGFKDGSMDDFEHNYEIAKEAMISWRRASEKERQRYIDYSIEEFEENVIEWKQDETIRKMLENEDNEINSNDFGQEDVFLEQDNFWKRKLKSLTSGYKVECKRLKGENSNQVLFELLQDTRFHPFPMIQLNREEEQVETVENKGKAVLNFHVSGPIATGIGDECLGCARGWNHFCPIVGRPLPAVKWRAKLQPPEASLVATRIGLGLPFDQNKVFHLDNQISGLPLANPSKRGDQILDLIDRLVAVKSSDIHKDTTSTPLIKTFICENCKRFTRDNNGCLSCRRLKIISEDAAKVPAKDPRPKLQTVMLPISQSTMIDNFDEQSKSDKRVAEHMTRNTWIPNAVLPRSTEDYVANADSKSNHEENIGRSEVNDNHISTGEVDERHQLTRRYLRRSSAQYVDVCTDSITQENAEAHREEATKIHNKCLFIAMSQILVGLLKRDPMKLFANPVSKEVEDYHKIIKTPIDFSIIKERVVKGEYKSLGAFAADIRLLCINSQIYNPPGTVYDTTANEIATSLERMTKRASDWIAAIKNAHASFYSRKCKPDRQWKKQKKTPTDKQDMDPFYGLRKTWPDAIELLERDENQMKAMLKSKFLRTKENEMAYYGALALRRSAVAIDASVALIFESSRPFIPAVRRTADDDEELRNSIDLEVSSAAIPHDVVNPPSETETRLLGIVKRIRKQHTGRKITPDALCSRCVPKDCHEKSKIVRLAEIRCSTGTRKRKITSEQMNPRVDKSRLPLSSGLASKVEQDRINTIDIKTHSRGISQTRVRGSDIQGWGLYTERRFSKDDIVAEYMGEYIQNPIADKREKNYEDNHIQDYQFRVSYELVIDATKHGGFARYINHSCDPNCVAKIIDGEPPNQHFKRVIIVAQQDIRPGEEISYDYQFPIELDLSKRIPCSCGATKCRGFMNWDINDSISSPHQGKKKMTGRKN